MRRLHAGRVVRWSLVGAALVALISLMSWTVDRANVARQAAKYARQAAYYDGMARRCREIVALDPAVRDRRAEEAFDDPFLDHPEWARRMIGFFEELANKYRRAAATPRSPVPPDPPPPSLPAVLAPGSTP